MMKLRLKLGVVFTLATGLLYGQSSVRLETPQ